MTEQRPRLQTVYQTGIDFSSSHFRNFHREAGSRQSAYQNSTDNPTPEVPRYRCFDPQIDTRYQVIIRHKASGLCRMMRYYQSESPDQIVQEIKRRFAALFEKDESLNPGLIGKNLTDAVKYFANRDPIRFFDLQPDNTEGWEFVDVRPIVEDSNKSQTKVFNFSFMARFVLDRWVNSARKQMKTYSGIKIDLDNEFGYVILDSVYDMPSLNAK